jgi:hypothetical protein
MRRRSSKLPNAQSRKAKTLKAVRHRSSSGSGRETKIARLTRERDEALIMFRSPSALVNY